MLVSLLHLCLLLTLSLDIRMFCSVFFFQFYFFLALLIFFSQKDFMVCYFNFLNSYSENGMLFF